MLKIKATTILTLHTIKKNQLTNKISIIRINKKVSNYSHIQNLLKHFIPYEKR